MRGTVGRNRDASTKSDRKQEHSTCRASVKHCIVNNMSHGADSQRVAMGYERGGARLCGACASPPRLDSHMLLVDTNVSRSVISLLLPTTCPSCMASYIANVVALLESVPRSIITAALPGKTAMASDAFANAPPDVQQPGVIALKSGLRYKVIRAAPFDAKSPLPLSPCECHYVRWPASI